MLMQETQNPLTPDWREELANAITSLPLLLQKLHLNEQLAGNLLADYRKFPLRVPQSFVNRMQPGNVKDPLLLQILPITQELLAAPGYTGDPLEETKVNPIPGLLHKYHGRVLVIGSRACSIHCRYCFRRHFPYADNQILPQHWQQILAYIKQNLSIHEVILSGGDPLILPDQKLQQFANDIAAIPHVKTLRIHSRIPVVIPSRITDEFIAWFTASRLTPILVIHCNHPQEIDPSVQSAMLKLRRAGVTVLNQSVLLHQVNDDPDCLIELSHRLFDMGVLPYYLNVLDKVQGTAHFATTLDQAQAIHQQLQARLSGYLVPRLVTEVAGAKSKITVS